MKHRTLTPLGSVVKGALAGAAGTVAMDLVWFSRYRRGGGKDRFVDWEFSSGVEDWDEAPAPAQLAKRVGEGYLQTEIPPEKAGVLNNTVHWSYGMLWGAVYGILAGSAKRARPAYGLLLGTLVWGAAYVALPLAKLYEPMWKYEMPTLTKDLSAHLAYGLATSTAFRVLLAGRNRSTRLSCT